MTNAGYDIRYQDTGVDGFAEAAAADPSVLIVLGGPVGVYETDRYPRLADGFELLAKRLAAQRPTIDICLGAQLMAQALGVAAYPGPAKEIGVAPVTLTAAGERVLGRIGGRDVLHWHGDTFDLPARSDLLASTPAYADQAFVIGSHALDLQFHAEVEARRPGTLVGRPRARTRARPDRPRPAPRTSHSA